MTTKLRPANLAVRQPAHRMDPRVAERRLRVALADLVTRTPTARTPWDDNRRREPRSALPCEKERAMIHSAIRNGCTTPERVIGYRLFQMRDDLAQFEEAPDVGELLYVQLIREQAEALDAQSQFHARRTPAHAEIAIKETEDVVTLGRAFVGLLRAGGALLHRTH